MARMSEHVPFDDFGGRGPLLHFAHANGYPPRTYRPLLERLAGRFRVLAVHHRPLWSAGPPADLDSWHAVADDLVRFFDEQGLRGSIGVGHSIGAVVTFYAALRRPELFRALVLIDPVILIPAVLRQMTSLGHDAVAELPLIKIAGSRRNHFDSLDEAFGRFRRKRIFARLSDEALRDYVAGALQPVPEGGYRLAYPPEWEARIYALPPQEVWDLLPQVTHPTLAIRGAESDTLSPAAWQMWQMAQPAATFAEIPGTGHLLPLEQPALVAAQIDAFFDAIL
jgi:pimeloyl-ACP methyl ester carboxylesterase